MIRIDESLQLPHEGIFWFINGELISLSDPINPKDPYDCTDLTHKESWNSLCKNYLVNNHIVPYDYFPRGRVETLVILNEENTIDYYESHIYMDKCIYTKDIVDKVIQDFRLYLPKVKVSIDGQLFVDGSHYTCHDCN